MLREHHQNSPLVRDAHNWGCKNSTEGFILFHPIKSSYSGLSNINFKPKLVIALLKCIIFPIFLSSHTFPPLSSFSLTGDCLKMMFSCSHPALCKTWVITLYRVLLCHYRDSHCNQFKKLYFAYMAASVPFAYCTNVSSISSSKLQCHWTTGSVQRLSL